MTYRQFDYIPYKILIKIIETDDLRLLSDDENITDDELVDIWLPIYKEYLSINASPEAERLVKITREIYYTEAKYELILTYCKIMAFCYNEEIIDQLIGFGYRLTHDTYLDEIENIQREAQGLLVKSQNLRKQLPVIEDNVKVSIDDMLACYSAILGIDFDYNTVSAAKVIALGKQIDLKIKSIQNNNQNGK